MKCWRIRQLLFGERIYFCDTAWKKMETSVLLHTFFILQQSISNIDLTDNVLEKELGDRAEPEYGKKFWHFKFHCIGECIIIRIAFKSLQNYSSLTGTVMNWNIGKMNSSDSNSYKYMAVVQNSTACNSSRYNSNFVIKSCLHVYLINHKNIHFTNIN